jgi:GNAT superfamily N-acetyltransferase
MFISHFCVLPEWRNFGAGSYLMNELMGYNVRVKNRYLVLIATSAGEKLYTKFGFRKVTDVVIRSFSEDI